MEKKSINKSLIITQFEQSNIYVVPWRNKNDALTDHLMRDSLLQ